MVERILLIRLHDSTEPSRALARAAVQGALRGHPKSARCGVPADAEAARSWDLAIVAEATTPASDAALIEGVQAALGDRIAVLKTWVFAW